MADDQLDLFGDSDNPTAAEDDLRTAASLQALMQLPGVGSARAIRLAQGFGSWAKLLASSPEQIRSVVRTRLDVMWRPTPIEMTEGIRMIGWFDDSFPSLLREIPNPPAILWVRGELSDPERRLAVVGTRTPTSWGIEMAASIATETTVLGLCVVSGLALGVDIVAHRAALEANGRTIAVLGSGVDRPTPKEHAPDAEAILESGGALISEVPLGTPPSPQTLVSRNRLQAGLSLATIVVQCGRDSGTMKTARFALDQGRALAVPLPPDSETDLGANAGTRELIGQTQGPDGSKAWTTTTLTSREDLRLLLSSQSSS